MVLTGIFWVFFAILAATRLQNHVATMSETPTLALSRRVLPIGIASFAKVREQNAYYVDKTAYAW